jgi:leucine dehydrogenase
MNVLSEAKKVLEFDNHSIVERVEDPEVGLNGFIAIHRISKDFPALGATRLWSYASEQDALRDALRLSKLMTYKSILAGLPYTGAKAVLIYSDKAQANRSELFARYSQKVNELSGKFITGTDVGVSNEDLEIMSKNSPYMIGQGVDSGYYTAIAVYNGIKLALKYVYGEPDVTKHSFAIQGLGKTGYPLLKFLMRDGAGKVYVSDINTRKLSRAKIDFPSVEVVDHMKLHSQPAEVFYPCALSNSINDNSINYLQGKIVAGSANNQLNKIEMGDILFAKKILYAPDYVINGGGLISVVDQFEHKKHVPDSILAKLQKVNESLEAIFSLSNKQNKPPSLVADEQAKKILIKRGLV